MEITGLQIVFILIALAEWIITKSTVVFRGYLAEGWSIPAGMESARYVAVFGILYAYYIGGRLIYRKKSDDSQPFLLRSGGILWAFFFYVPYLLYSLAGHIVVLFRENGRAEGAVLFLVTLLAFIWLIVTLYKMPKEHPATLSLYEMERQKQAGGKSPGERIFRVCLVAVFILMWVEPASLSLRGFFLPSILSLLRPLMLIYILIWPKQGSHKDETTIDGI